MQISKELLSEVLQTKLKRHDSAFVKITDIGIDNSMVHINYQNSHRIICLFMINIYELAHKCKEWAKSKDYYILSGYDDTNIPVSLINHHYGEGGCSCDEYFETNTEPEAIFKACDYIILNMTQFIRE